MPEAAVKEGLYGPVELIFFECEYWATHVSHESEEHHERSIFCLLQSVYLGIVGSSIDLLHHLLTFQKRKSQQVQGEGLEGDIEMMLQQ